MTIATSRRSISALVVFLVTLLFAGGPRSIAQQGDRQLSREGQSTRTNERRLALVIGNGAYTNAPPLKNPPNDARDMATTLKELGFDVTSGINLSQREMKNLIRDFGQKLKGGGSGLFYYAGHGVQSKGRNYLIPIEADIQSEVEVEDAGVDVNLVLGYMDDAQNGLNIVILDACRNNPFGRSFRSASNGLAAVDAPTGTLIAYATAPGRVASDGTGQNGLYTAELLKQMRVPGLSATDLFMHVRAEVMKQTANKQVPWEASSLVGAFYFAGGKGANPSLPNDSSRISDSAKEQALWDAVKDSTDPKDLQDYLSRYPNGAYVAAATIKVRRLEAKSRPEDSSTANQVLPVGPCNDDVKRRLYQKFFENYRSEHKVAYGAAKEFLATCPNVNDDNAQYLKRWVPAYEKVEGLGTVASCPSISVNCPNGPSESIAAGNPVTFTANVSGGPGGQIYNWMISDGTITSGQGTSSITVDTRGLAGRSVTATVELGGLDPSCKKVTSCTVSIKQN